MSYELLIFICNRIALLRKVCNLHFFHHTKKIKQIHLTEINGDKRLNMVGKYEQLIKIGRTDLIKLLLLSTRMCLTLTLNQI